MRAAPPVAVPLGSGQPERMVTILLHALAGAVLTAWTALHAGLRPGGVMAFMALAAGALMAALGWVLATRALPARADTLRWDGQVWRCDGLGDAPLGRVVVAIDLGVWVLLCLHPATSGPPGWRVASARTAQGGWHGLRLALAAHAGAARLPPVEPPL